MKEISKKEKGENKKNMTTLKNNQIIRIKTDRNVFGAYEGLARVTLKKVDYIWLYNGYICAVELLEPNNLDNNYMPIEPNDIIQVF